MQTIEIAKIAWQGLRNNPFRSFLTLLGVVIGVTSVIIMTALGGGAQEQVAKQIEGLGSKLLIVSPGRMGMGGGGSGAAGSANVLTLDLMKKLAKGATSLEAAAGEGSGTKTVSYKKNALPTSVVGVSPEYWEIRNLKLTAGNYFKESDYKSKTRVAIIAPFVANELFGAENPIGKEVKIANFKFKIVGLSEPKGQSGMINLDDRIYIPLETALYKVFGTIYLRSIYLKVKPDSDMVAAQTEADEIIYKKTKDKSLYNIRNQDDILNTAKSTTDTFTLMMAGIASVSLLVGGIGIMNIMLVSVTERIKEIGLRKAVGASKQEIMFQFLLEAVALSAIGGIVGVILGFLGAFLLNLFMGWPVKMDFHSVGIAVVFSVAVGLFFGVYPASRAARLHPLEALRYE